MQLPSSAYNFEDRSPWKKRSFEDSGEIEVSDEAPAVGVAAEDPSLRMKYSRSPVGFLACPRYSHYSDRVEHRTRQWTDTATRLRHQRLIPSMEILWRRILSVVKFDSTREWKVERSKRNLHDASRNLSDIKILKQNIHILINGRAPCTSALPTEALREFFFSSPPAVVAERRRKTINISFYERQAGKLEKLLLICGFRPV